MGNSERKTGCVGGRWGVGDEEKIRCLSKNENDHLQKKEAKRDTDEN